MNRKTFLATLATVGLMSAAAMAATQPKIAPVTKDIVYDITPSGEDIGIITGDDPGSTKKPNLLAPALTLGGEQIFLGGPKAGPQLADGSGRVTKHPSFPWAAVGLTHKPIILRECAGRL